MNKFKTFSISKKIPVTKELAQEMEQARKFYTSLMMNSLRKSFSKQKEEEK